MGQAKSKVDGESVLFQMEVSSKAFGRLALCETKNLKRKLFACEAKYSTQEPHFYFKLKHQNVMTPVTYDYHFKEFLNGDSTGMTFYFDYLEDSLEERILSRMISLQPFNEEEIIGVCYDVLSAMSYLKQFGMEVGNIVPATIFSHQNRTLCEGFAIQVELIYWLFFVENIFQGQFAGYQLIVNHELNQVLPSPEILYASKRKDIAMISRYRFATDVFTLGMSLLEMATLMSSKAVFQIEARIISPEKLTTRIERLKEKNSTFIFELISRMITLNPEERPTCDTLIAMIRRHKLEQNKKVQLQKDPNYQSKNKENEIKHVQVPIQNFKVFSSLPLKYSQNNQQIVSKENMSYLSNQLSQTSPIKNQFETLQRTPLSYNNNATIPFNLQKQQPFKMAVLRAESPQNSKLKVINAGFSSANNSPQGVKYINQGSPVRVIQQYQKPIDHKNNSYQQSPFYNIQQQNNQSFDGFNSQINHHLNPKESIQSSSQFDSVSTSSWVPHSSLDLQTRQTQQNRLNSIFNNHLVPPE